MRRGARKRWGFGLKAVAAAGLLVWLAMPDLHATPSEAERLQAICESPLGMSRRLIVLERLRSMRTESAREALNALCDSERDEVAMAAIACIGRDNPSAAKRKCEAIFEATSRSDNAREMALVVLLRLFKAEGKTWAEVGKYVKQKSGTNARLRGGYEAGKTKHWPEASDE